MTRVVELNPWRLVAKGAAPTLSPVAARARAAAIDLIAAEGLTGGRFVCRFVDIAAIDGDVLYVGDDRLPAPRLIPATGRLTGLAIAACTLGAGIEGLIARLCAERRMSLAVATDSVANEMLFAVTRCAHDRLLADGRKLDRDLAGELRAGDPGLPLSAQGAVLRLAGAGRIGIGLTEGGMMRPLRSATMVLGVGIDLPPATWSRCDDCPSRRKCRHFAARPSDPVEARR